MRLNIGTRAKAQLREARTPLYFRKNVHRVLQYGVPLAQRLPEVAGLIRRVQPTVC